MGSRDFDGGNDSLGPATWVWPGYPFTLSIWCQKPVLSSGVDAMISYKVSTSTARFVLTATRDAGPDGDIVWKALAYASLKSSASANWRESGPDPFPNYWYHIVGVFESTTSRKLYTQGVLRATNATSITLFTGPSRIYVGEDGTGSAYFDGKLCHPAVYDVALNANEIRSMYGWISNNPPAESGSNPMHVRQMACKGYWPIHGLRSPEPNLVGGIPSLTVNGATVASGSPPIAAPAW